jgi:uncharacterized membrane protein (UPF0127 family)
MLICVFVVVSTLLLSCSHENQSYVTITPGKGKPVRVYVEVADTPALRQQGLMFRDSLGKKNGMLFIMPEETIQSFWMKETRIPLDIIFIYSDWTIVGIAENTKPFSPENITVNRFSKYVLEVNGGFCKKYRIQSGDKIAYHPVKVQ